MPRRRASAAAVVFALLVVATIAAFAWSQRLKRDPLILDHVSFATPARRPPGPHGACRAGRVRIRFRVTRSDRAVVQVVKPHGRLVATLARGRFLERYHFFTFWWDGRNRHGGLAPPGRYRLRVELLEQERTLVPPFVLHLRRPQPEAASGCAKVRALP